MRKKSTALLVAAVLGIALAVFAAETPTVEDRVASLELRVTALEARIAELTPSKTGTVSPDKITTIPKSGDWKDKRNWRDHLRRGLTKAEVTEILGEPDKVTELLSGDSWWYYGYPSGGQINFDDTGRVESWREP